MKPYAMQIDQLTANLVLCAGLLFCGVQAHAGDAVQVATVELLAPMPTPTPTPMPTPMQQQPIILPATTVGGVTAGQVILITERSSEVMNVAAAVQKQADFTAKLPSHLFCGF